MPDAREESTRRYATQLHIALAVGALALTTGTAVRAAQLAEVRTYIEFNSSDNDLGSRKVREAALGRMSRAAGTPRRLMIQALDRLARRPAEAFARREQWEFTGYLYGAHYTHSAAPERICIDHLAYDGTVANSPDSGAPLYPTRVQGASATDVPVNNSVQCAVCCTR